jgi:hypothetical protein
VSKTWTPWKAASIGMALMIATALVTGLVVGNWHRPESETRPATGQNTVTADKPTITEPTSRPASSRGGHRRPGM